MLSIFRNLQKYSVSPPPETKPLHCLGSYIYLPYTYLPFQGFTFITYLTFRDIHSLHTCLFMGYTCLPYIPAFLWDIHSLHTCLSGIYIPYIPAFSGIYPHYIPAFQGYIFLTYLPFQGYTFLTYLPFRDINSLHTCLSGI